ncbi:hypothetical protein BABINDRAFT_169862 [Babjeviella inositovora NRRL Y-12698]|uniref:Porphobilinogen deaminase n=1 Tax=Babjeviella inositovora NRRL Y-12698 TaxID=984486 RepID=A0A1E3QYF3_9ASCO|nr:uncharacterized protein BABINDRAFT_169862 [Babjeviella inositovora NRRL Y-12698]ODQ82624.1 hypothetical protein BABINDRAFT_169862 [Babjeviella inositovora NRRL Y-12698]
MSAHITNLAASEKPELERARSFSNIEIGGRKSKLAVIQSESVKALILKQFPDLKCSVLALSTFGDHIQNRPLYSFGGKALWTKELETLLMQSVEHFPKLDLVVHSLKDMPTNLPEEFELGAILTRDDPRDALVMKSGSPHKTLYDLAPGSVVGTSSVRRSAQLLRHHPHLRFESVRGNVQTRLNKLDDPASEYECLILAAAGLNRLGMNDRITHCLEAPEMYYAVGQGALGIEIRKGDMQMKRLLSHLENKATAYCCLAERALMRTLEGGCSVPIGVKTSYDEVTQVLRLDGIVISVDGQEFVEDVIEVPCTSNEEADGVGVELAARLTEKGAKRILEEINFEKINQAPLSIPSTPLGATPPQSIS